LVIEERGKKTHESKWEDAKGKKYRIDIGAYGSIGIEAPTKEECLELFKEVTKTVENQKSTKQSDNPFFAGPIKF
jgi:hypothetical protein